MLMTNNFLSCLMLLKVRGRVMSNQIRYCSSGSPVQWAEQLVRFDKSHHSSAAARENLNMAVMEL